MPRLAALGHDVTISAYFGLAGAPAQWQGITILPGSFPGDLYGTGVLREHVKRREIDLVITLMDIWPMDAGQLQGLPVAHWMPVDCAPLGTADKRALDVSGAIPVAMSQFGHRMLTEAGYAQALYVPHGIDTSYWHQVPERDEIREALGADGKFAIGINANNKDSFRKGMFEQCAAFAKLNKDHPDTVLMIHALVHEAGALDLGAMVTRLGIAGATRFVDQYEYTTGMVGQEHLRNWYSGLDLYSQASWGEGFGLTCLEAQACGIPVVVTDASAMSETCGGGWKVQGEPVWNPVHNACWTRPSIGAIHRAYEQAYQRGRDYTAKQARCVPFAAKYDAGLVEKEHWIPVLEELERRVADRKAPA